MWRLSLIWFVLFAGIAFTWCSRRKSEIQTVTNRIIIKFKADVSPTSADSLARQMNLTLVTEIPQIGARVYEVPANAQTEKVIQRCRLAPEIEYAEPDYTVRTMETPVK